MNRLTKKIHPHTTGTALEQSEGAAQQLVFVLFNVAVLSLLGALLGLPVTSNALITAALHVLGRLDPMRDVQWMFSIKVGPSLLCIRLGLVIGWGHGWRFRSIDLQKVNFH